MPKLQRHPEGKLCRGEGGKVIANETEACGCTPPEPPEACGKIYNTNCLPGTDYMPTVYKVAVAGNTICTGCIDRGDGTSIQVSGSINREFYIAYDPGSSSSNASLRSYFPTSSSGALNATYYQSSNCTGTVLATAEMLGVSLLPLQHDLAVGQQTATLQIFDTAAFADAFTTVYGTNGTGLTGANVTNICGAADTITNTSISGDCATYPSLLIGYGGTATVTPCPPCAVDCDGPACIEVTSSGTCNIAPDGQFNSNGQMPWTSQGLTNAHWALSPAGCVWSYSRLVDNPNEMEWYAVYIWFDGQDYRGMLTHFINGAESAVAYSYEAGSVTCTAGVLAGSLTLKTPDKLCTITVSLTCAECHELTAVYDSNAIVYFNNTANFPAGDYTVELLYGAISYDLAGGQKFRVNAVAGNNYYAIISNGAEMGEAPPAGQYAEYDTEALHTAAWGGSTVTFTHGGGAIGIKLIDTIYSDNGLDPDGRAPRFKLCRV